MHELWKWNVSWWTSGAAYKPECMVVKCHILFFCPESNVACSLFANVGYHIFQTEAAYCFISGVYILKIILKFTFLIFKNVLNSLSGQQNFVSETNFYFLAYLC